MFVSPHGKQDAFLDRESTLLIYWWGTAGARGHSVNVLTLSQTDSSLSELQDAPGRSAVHAALVLESVLSPRSPGSFYWKIFLETKIWVLGVYWGFHICKIGKIIECSQICVNIKWTNIHNKGRHIEGIQYMIVQWRLKWSFCFL